MHRRRAPILALILVACLLAAPSGPRAGAQGESIPAPQPGTYILRLDSGALIPLTSRRFAQPGADFAWQPDGSHLAVLGSDSQTISIVDATSGQATPLVQVSKGTVSAIWWSPDGSNLAYGVQNTGGSAGALFIAPLSGTPAVQIAAFDPPSVAWMPDGTAVTVVQTVSDSYPYIGQVVTLDAATGDQRTVNIPASAGLCPIGLTWSPDGNYLAFAEGGIENTLCEQNEAAFGLWVVTAATGELRQLATGKVFGSGLGLQKPQWLTGDRIFAQILSSAQIVPATGSPPAILNDSVSTSLADGPAQLANGVLIDRKTAASPADPSCGVAAVWVQTPATAAPRQLSSPGEYAVAPSLAPDGSGVLWSSIGRSGSDLVLVSADGSTRRTLVQGAASFDSFGWSPDGSAITFTVSGNPPSYFYTAPPCTA